MLSSGRRSGSGPTKIRHDRALRDGAFDTGRDMALLETQALCLPRTSVRAALCFLDPDVARRLFADVPMKFLTPVLVVVVASIAPFALGQIAQTVAAQKTTSAPPDRGRYFPPPMQSFALYGDGKIPNSKPSPDEESGADRGFVRNVSRPQIEVYLPASSRANGASMLIFPGGGYAGLTFDYEGTQQARFFVAHGFAAFVVKYRVPSDQTMENKSIGPLQDAQQALRFVRLHAKEWNLDPARVGAIGFSAGGHVASAIWVRYGSSLAGGPIPSGEWSILP